MTLIVEPQRPSGLNDGIFVLGRGTRPAVDTDPKTVIVSGLARSGTSMVARILAEAGVFLGEAKDEIVYEDHELARFLEKQDLVRLRRAIAARNLLYDLWGFKKPNIHDFINPKHRSFFRNPYYIFTFRDPVAIAKRNIVSELFEDTMSLGQVVKMQAVMVKFILRLRHPVLLISYEKALEAPAQCAESIAAFVGLTVDEDRKERMLASVEPNRREYLASARRSFEGSIDGIAADVLRGWCRQAGLLDPIEVDVVINETRVATVLADAFREDLAAAGMGSGEHAFNIDLRKYKPDPSHVVRIFAHGRAYELAGSGKTVGELREL